MRNASQIRQYRCRFVRPRRRSSPSGQVLRGTISGLLERDESERSPEQRIVLGPSNAVPCQVNVEIRFEIRRSVEQQRGFCPEGSLQALNGKAAVLFGPIAGLEEP